MKILFFYIIIWKYKLIYILWIKDTLKTADKCLKAAENELEMKHSVVIGKYIFI